MTNFQNSALKLEDIERTELKLFNPGVSTLDILTFPLIKQEIKDEPESFDTKVLLKRTKESLANNITEQERTSSIQAACVKSEHIFKDELCFDESYIDVCDKNIIRVTAESKKNVGLQEKNGKVEDTFFLTKYPNSCRMDGKRYICNDYSKLFTNKSNPKYHIPTHKRQIPKKCNICGKCFAIKSTLKIHLLTHSGEKPFICDVCGKSFKLKEHLKCHIHTHSSERPFKCEVCGKSSKSKPILKVHLATHSDHKPFKCNICGKCFAIKSTLKIHILTHSGERPFICDVCGKSFKMKEYLKYHLLTHIDKIPIYQM